MKTFALTSKAKADLRAIAIFTEERWGKEQRNLYIKQFDDAFHMLANAPLAGKACDYIKNGYRKFPQEGARRRRVPLERRVSGFLANDSDCEHHVTQPKYARDHHAPHKTNRKGTVEGALGELWELPQHKAEVLVLAVLAATQLQQ